MHNAYGIAISVRGDPWTNRTPLGGEQSIRWSLPHFLLFTDHTFLFHYLMKNLEGTCPALSRPHSLVNQL